MGAWQLSRCCQRKPGRDLNGSITTSLIIKTPASPVAILVSLLKPPTGGSEGTILNTWKVWETDLAVLRESASPPTPQSLLSLSRGWQGFSCSASAVGRIINRLKARGILNELAKNHISTQWRRNKRPYAISKPKDYPDVIGATWSSWTLWKSGLCRKRCLSSLLRGMLSAGGMSWTYTDGLHLSTLLVSWMLWKNECPSLLKLFRWMVALNLSRFLRRSASSGIPGCLCCHPIHPS